MKIILAIFGVIFWTCQALAAGVTACNFNGSEFRPSFLQAAQPNSGGNDFILGWDVATSTKRIQGEDQLTIIDDPVGSHLRLCALKPSNPVSIYVAHASPSAISATYAELSENNCVDIIASKVIAQKIVGNSASAFKPLPTSAYGKLGSTTQACLGHDGTYWSKIWWAVKGNLNTQPVFLPSSGIGSILIPVIRTSKYQPILIGNKDIKLRICTDTPGVVFRYMAGGDNNNEKEFTANLNCTSINGSTIYIDLLKSPQKTIKGTYTLVDN